MFSILIVEDDESLRTALSSNLAQRGFSVLEARDGEEGLAMALREHPDIILLDVKMPKMDGMEVMRKLREDIWGKDASIIFLSNYDTDETQLRQIATDLPSYYLIKANSTLEYVLEKVNEELKSKKLTTG